jgi:hypothetical protein
LKSGRASNEPNPPPGHPPSPVPAVPLTPPPGGQRVMPTCRRRNACSKARSRSARRSGRTHRRGRPPCWCAGGLEDSPSGEYATWRRAWPAPSRGPGCRSTRSAPGSRDRRRPRDCRRESTRITAYSSAMFDSPTPRTR